MRTMGQLALSSLLAAYAFGQASQVPYAPDGDGPGPTFKSENVSLSFPSVYLSIQKVDFRNFRLLILDAAGRPAGSIRFKSGRYKYDHPDGHYSEEVDSVHYLSGSSNGGSALVLYSWFSAGGSSSSGGTAHVFTVSGGHLRSVQKIDWDTHFQAGQPTDSFDPSTNTLVIRSAHYIPGDAHCCVSAMDVVTFRWDGTSFIQTGIQTELSQYGKKEGKTLPRRVPD
jgi:hypothetical protein